MSAFFLAPSRNLTVLLSIQKAWGAEAALIQLSRQSKYISCAARKEQDISNLSGSELRHKNGRQRRVEKG